jgi:uncharacterized OB-fold protein
MTVEKPGPRRMLPEINDMNQYFWCGGADGRLHILQCGDCATYIHPYAARCSHCRSANLSPQPVSGQGVVVGVTVNYQPWIPGVETPYVVALVELDEQADIRLMTNMPRTPVDDVRIGMRVKVHFEQNGDVYVPLFEAA